LQPFREYLLV
jgi:hypothetical protein